MKLPPLDGLLNRLGLADRIPGSPGERVLLELDLARGVSESGPSNPLEAIRALRTPQLRALVEHLRKAETDDAVVGLIATLPGDGITFAQSDELRAAVHRFRATGKPTLAWSATFGELTPGNVGYHLAAAFDQVWLQPSGRLGLVGFHADALFLRGSLDKLGVEPQFGQRHEYKSAADTFMRTGPSEANREMLDRLLASTTQTLVADIAADRRLDPAEVFAAIDAAPLAPGQAQTRGLIDRVGYRDEAYAALRGRLGERGGAATLRYVERHGVSKFEAVLGQLPKPSTKPAIAVISAIGGIVLSLIHI